MFKKICTGILCLLVLFSIVGCTQDPDNVKLANAKQMEKWCKRNFGECEVGDYKTTESGDRKFPVTDKEKGFEYSATSYVHTIWFDTVLGYNEEKSSSFPDKYMNYFKKEYAKEIETISTRVELDDSTYSTFYDVHAQNEETGLSAAREILSFADEYDTRDYWGNTRINIYIGNEYVGYVDDDGFMTKQKETEKYLLNAAAQDMGVDSELLKFTRSETVPVDSIPNVQNFHLASIFGSDNDIKSNTLVVWFTYKGHEYYVTDLVYDLCEHCSLLHHIGDYPLDCEKDEGRSYWLKYLSLLL